MLGVTPLVRFMKENDSDTSFIFMVVVVVVSGTISHSPSLAAGSIGIVVGAPFPMGTLNPVLAGS